MDDNMLFLICFAVLCAFVFGVALYLRRQRDKSSEPSEGAVLITDGTDGTGEENTLPSGRPRIQVGGGASISNVRIANPFGDVIIENCRAGRRVRATAGAVTIEATDEGTTIVVPEGSEVEGVLNGKRVKVASNRGEGTKKVVIPR